MLAEFDGGGTRTQRYAYLDGDHAPTQVQDLNGTFYVHADHVDTPRLATSSVGAVIWKSRYEAFGTAVVDTDPDGNSQFVTLNQRFSGQYKDNESGNHYNYFRDFDPKTGRYLQGDPIGLRGGLNIYEYGYSNPITEKDPSGLQPLARPPRRMPGREYVPPRYRNDRPPWLHDQGLPRPPSGPYPPGFNDQLYRDLDFYVDRLRDSQLEHPENDRRRRALELLRDWMRRNPPPEPHPSQCGMNDDLEMDNYLELVRRMYDYFDNEWSWAPPTR